MLKGHVFKKQIFGNQIFALFIDTFLKKNCGISSNYKNAMKVTYSGSNLTVQSGAACIRGRFVEEDIGTTISAGTDSAYCRLVIEIDLSKENTASEFKQAQYKIVKGTSSYPNLTQTDIVANNSGIYQYELAQFRTSSSGISSLVDKRTYLDFDSIYEQIQGEYRSILTQLQTELTKVVDGSAYVLNTVTEFSLNKNDITGIAVKQGKIVTIRFKIEGTLGRTTQNIELPAGFIPRGDGKIYETFVEFAGSEVQTVKKHATVEIGRNNSNLAEIGFLYSGSSNISGTITYTTD